MSNCVNRYTPLLAALENRLKAGNGKYVSAWDLMDAIWPDVDKSPEWSYGTLKVHVFRLRKLLPVGAIESRTGGGRTGWGWRWALPDKERQTL